MRCVGVATCAEHVVNLRILHLLSPGGGGGGGGGCRAFLARVWLHEERGSKMETKLVLKEEYGNHRTSAVCLQPWPEMMHWQAAKQYQFSVIVYLCNRVTYCRSLFLELHVASNSSSAKTI